MVERRTVDSVYAVIPPLPTSPAFASWTRSCVQRSIIAEDKSVEEHATALQGLANEKMMAYAQTLRRVQCEGSRTPHQASQVSRKAPVRSSLLSTQASEQSTAAFDSDEWQRACNCCIAMAS